MITTRADVGKSAMSYPINFATIIRLSRHAFNCVPTALLIDKTDQMA
jgi:hypothetical protein